MIKQIKVALTLLALLIAMSGCFGVDPKTDNYSIIVPIATLDAKVQEKFPIKREIDFGTLELFHPSLVGSSKSREKLEVELSFKLSNFLFRSGINGTIALSSGISYDSKTKNLYLKNPMLENLTIQSASLEKIITPSIKKQIEDVVAQLVSRYPIYNLKESGVAANFIKDITIRESKLYLNLGL